MSHRYGERHPSLPKVLQKHVSPDANHTSSGDQTENRPVAPPNSEIIKDGAANVIIGDEQSRRGLLDSTLPPPSSGDLDSWTLAKLRADLGETVIGKREANWQARENLETRRLSLIDRITRIERAEQKQMDAARRVIIGRDVEPPPPDPIERPWRKKRFGLNSRRSGPADAYSKIKRDPEDMDRDPEEELHSRRWRLKRKRVLEEVSEGTIEGEVDQATEQSKIKMEVKNQGFDADETETQNEAR